MKNLLVLALASVAVAIKNRDVLQFNNFGFDGDYTPVLQLNDPDLDQCSCQVGDPVKFSGANSPLDGEVAVQFQGPLKLLSFYAYSSEDYKLNSGDSQWTTIGKWDGNTAENITFLTPQGKDSKCLGKALVYAGSDGGASDQPETLLPNTELTLDQQIIIYSNDTCGDLGVNGDCGVYRDGIPAYHGFSGKAKLFVFKWQRLGDAQNLDKTAIRVLNAQIPRTLNNYRDKDNADCLCWRLGCGEFAVFEPMHKDYRRRFRPTLYDKQNAKDIDGGNTIDGYTKIGDGDVSGAILFTTDGTVLVLSNRNLDQLVTNDDMTSARVNAAAEDIKKKRVKDLNKKSGKGNKDRKGAAAGLTVPRVTLAVAVAAMLACVV